MMYWKLMLKWDVKECLLMIIFQAMLMIKMLAQLVAQAREIAMVNTIGGSWYCKRLSWEFFTFIVMWQEVINFYSYVWASKELMTKRSRTQCCYYRGCNCYWDDINEIIFTGINNEMVLILWFSVVSFDTFICSEILISIWMYFNIFFIKMNNKDR